MTSWTATSPSQVKTFRECARKWYLEKIEQYPVEARSTSAQSLGHSIHQSIANWMEKGEALTDERVLPAIPRLGRWRETVVGVERYFVFPVNDDVRVRGFIDLVLLSPDGRRITVIDHKTTKTSRYIRKGDDLLDDPQCIVYLYAMAREYPAVQEFVFLLHYIRTDAPRPSTEVPIPEVWSREEVESAWATFVQETAAMQDVASSRTRPVGNRGACWNYGGCAYRTNACAGDDALLAALDPERNAHRVPGDAFDEEPAQVLASLEEEEDRKMTMTPNNIVYVDCLPSQRAGVSTFMEWCDPLVKEYTAKQGKHPLLEPYQAGIRATAIAAASAWEAAPVPIIVLSADPIGALFVTLLPASANVVQRV